MTATAEAPKKAQLIKADTALRSFRDGGYTLADAVAEIVDNSLQSAATKIAIDWEVKDVAEGKSKKTRRQVEWFAIADNGSGIPAAILHNVLTVGFSTRYGNREGIGRFGVGFKLASISQAKRLEVYTRPAYLKAVKTKGEDDRDVWTFSEENEEGLVFRTVLDLEKIFSGEQEFYTVDPVDGFPEECDHMMDEGTGTLIVWRDTDRLNAEPKFAEKVDEKLASLAYFLRRAYRVYLSNGTEIHLRNPDKARGTLDRLDPYDPLFELDNPEADRLANGKPMKGEKIDEGKIPIDGHEVHWRVQLTPAVTRLEEGGGGEDGPDQKGQFKRLHIWDNEGKISFLRHNREISYTIVPKLLPLGVRYGDRYIGIQISFPPALDEYFQVKHIKRGAEPVEKLREDLRKALKKPVENARRKIRELWDTTEKNKPKQPDDVSGGRSDVVEVVKQAQQGLPSGRAGLTVTPDEDEKRLRKVANDAGIKDKVKQDEFVTHARQEPVVPVDVEWPGKGLLDIEHLSTTVVVRINRGHPFIKEVYVPLKDAIKAGAESLQPQQAFDLIKRAANGMDLLLFAYAKAENMSQNPEEDYAMLRDFWGTFASVYLRDLGKVPVS